MQNKAEKINVTEEDLIQANINSFGDDIGKITNWITTMFDVQSQFDPESEEFKTLAYRIISGQLLQQDAIDKAKGIISRQMPKEWYDRHSNQITEEDSEDQVLRKQFNMNILADKKPYFMRYIYNDVMQKYNTYIKNANKKSLREFKMSIDDMECLDQNDLSDVQKEFLHYFHSRMPVGNHDCVMNRICRKIETEFDGFFSSASDEDVFDYTILKSGQDYTKTQYTNILNEYVQYQKALQEHRQKVKSYRRYDAEAVYREQAMIAEEFTRCCFELCSNEKQLCDILLDICYTRSGTKQFCWDICGEVMLDNLLDKNDRKMCFPSKDIYGDIHFRGYNYSIIEKKVDEL